MYIPADLEKIVFDYLNVPELTGNIRGGLTYEDKRVNGNDEDVTVGSLALTDGFVQRGTVRVPIYCKDIQEPTFQDGIEVMKYVPNKDRIDEIVRIVHSVLGDNHGKFWRYGNLWIGTPTVSPKYRNIDLNEHFVVIRVELKLHQKNN